MSEPSEPAPLAVIHHRHLPPSSSSAEASAAAVASVALVRDYRKGNWTLHETLILITAKRLDDERRAGGASSSAANYSTSSLGIGAVTQRSAEQRWKWVENFCWRNGCLRSQNQCNDKWDNLLRDYKKVRDYEARVTAVAVAAASTTGEGSGGGEENADSERKPKRPSYWSMERHERKEQNLPTNMAAEVFEALTHVLSRRAARRGQSATPVSYRPPLPSPRSPPRLPLPSAPAASNPIPPPAPQLPPPPQPAPTMSISAEMSEESEENEEAAEPVMKRRRLRRLGSSMVRSATVLARTLLACEEKRELRHRELVELEERRLRLEEERTEMSRQSFAGLISAVNNLSGALHALASDYRNSDAGNS